jgi:hypothetical protein
VNVERVLDLLVIANVLTLVAQFVAFHSVGNARPHARFVAHLASISALSGVLSNRIPSPFGWLITPLALAAAGLAAYIFTKELQS